MGHMVTSRTVPRLGRGGGPPNLGLGRRANSVSPVMNGRTKSGASSTDAGAVDEDHFRLVFDEIPDISLQSGAEVEKELMSIHRILVNPGEDWERRVEQLKKLRSLVQAGAADYREFGLAMRYVDLALQTSVKDLRSQVVREACITLSYLAETLGMDCERTAEMTMPVLMLLLPNSAKVMASSGLVAIRFILNNVPSQKLVPLISQEYLNSKSKETRRACCDFLSICLRSFPKSAMERSVGSIREAIKRAISDADSEARALGRKAYSDFATVFPSHARDLFMELDSGKQRLLNVTPVQSSSQSSLLSDDSATLQFSRGKIITKSTTAGNLRALRNPKPTPVRQGPSLRSISAVDAAAARRAREKLIQQPAVQPASAAAALPVASSSHLQRSFRRYSAEKKSGLNGEGNGMNSTVHFGDLRTFTTKGAVTKSTEPQIIQQAAEEIPDIVAQLGSSNWMIKRDGLLNLQQYMLCGYAFLPSEMELIRTSFQRLLNEYSSNLINLLLDTLSDFVRIHNLQLGSWLYTLLSKLWTKQGAELGQTINMRLDNLLDLIRHSFPCEVQFQHIMRYISDASSGSTLNHKSKCAVMQYLVTLVDEGIMHPGDLKNSSTARLGITRVISWSLDGKSPEVRRTSQQVLVLLNHLNFVEFNSILSSFDGQTHDTAKKLISVFPRRGSAGLSEDAPKKKNGLTPVAPKVPAQTLRLQPSPAAKKPAGSPAILGGWKPTLKDRKLNDENVRPIDGAGYHTENGAIDTVMAVNGDRVRSGTTTERTRENGEKNGDVDGMSDPGTFLAGWSERFHTCPKIQRCSLLEQLLEILTRMSEEVWEEHFMVILPMLYDLLHLDRNGTNSDVTAGILKCFGAVLRLQPDRMRQFPELTIVSLLEIQHDATNTVAKIAEECVHLATRTFPCSVIAKILVPIINQSHVENVSAIKFFGVLCQQVAKEELIPVIPSVVPHIITALTTSEDSNVRKESVYALIYARMKVGDAVMDPYINQLPSSKVRLLGVYLKRVLQG